MAATFVLKLRRVDAKEALRLQGIDIKQVMSILGSVRSEKKAANARRNGKLGGRPRKKPWLASSEPKN